MKITFFCFITTFFFTINLDAQNFSFSQLETNQTLYHPAAFGLLDTKTRVSLGYRTHWTNVNSSVRNMLLSFQHKVKDFSVGTKIIQSDAGLASVKSSRILLDLSYKKKLNKEEDIIAFSVTGGLIQQRFREASFQFDNQYVEGEGFNSDLLNGESFSITDQIAPVLNASFIGEKHFNDFKINLGIAINNINKPVLGFYNDIIVSTPVEISGFGLISIPLGSYTDGLVYFVYNKFAIDTERIIGVKLNYELSNKYELSFGLANKLGNAFVLESGLTLDRVSFNFSFDVVNSLKSSMEGHKGIVELSANYIFVK